MMATAAKLWIPGNGQDKIHLWQKLFRDSQDFGFEVRLAEFKACHVRTDNAEFFSLICTHCTVHCGLDFGN